MGTLRSHPYPLQWLSMAFPRTFVIARLTILRWIYTLTWICIQIRNLITGWCKTATLCWSWRSGRETICPKRSARHWIQNGFALCHLIWSGCFLYILSSYFSHVIFPPKPIYDIGKISVQEKPIYDIGPEIIYFSVQAKALYYFIIFYSIILSMIAKVLNFIGLGYVGLCCASVARIFLCFDAIYLPCWFMVGTLGSRVCFKPQARGAKYEANGGPTNPMDRSFLIMFCHYQINLADMLSLCLHTRIVLVHCQRQMS